MLENIVDSIFQKINDALLGWIPSWVWELAGWWQWILGAIGATVAIGVLYRVYKVGGWPALTAFVGTLGLIVGYVLGKLNVKPPNQPVTQTKSTNKKHRKTITDLDGDGIPNWKDK